MNLVSLLTASLGSDPSERTGKGPRRSQVSGASSPPNVNGAETPSELASFAGMLGLLLNRIAPAETGGPAGVAAVPVDASSADAPNRSGGARSPAAPSGSDGPRTRARSPEEVPPPLPHDPTRVHPELLRRVERVIERMAQEHGHEVRIVEGYRSPNRQARLYAQGRTAPGPVVTWTRRSLHTEGRAVDLQVNGVWDDPRAYADLQRIARDEGLRTLGMKDPGHVELPRGAGLWTVEEGGSGRPEPLLKRAPRARPASPAGVARIPEPARPGPTPGSNGPAPSSRAAVPARIAETARIAEAARPPRAVPRIEATALSKPNRTPESLGARPTERPNPIPPSGSERPHRPPGIGTPSAFASRPGAPSRGRVRSSDPTARERSITPRAPLSTAYPGGDGPSATPAQERLAGTSPRFRNGGSDGGAPGDEGNEVGARFRGEEASLSDTGALQLRRTGGTRSPSPAKGTTGSSAAHAGDPVSRAHEIRSLGELERPRPLGLRLENVDGRGTEVRLALRGADLTARIEATDPAAARRMRARIDELHRNLRQRGLEPRSLEVQTAEPVSSPDREGPSPSSEARTSNSNRSTTGGHGNRRDGGPSGGEQELFDSQSSREGTDPDRNPDPREEEETR